MRKLMTFTVIVIFLFTILATLMNISNKRAVVGNLYEKETLHQSTLEQLHDPLYSNQILPNELIRKLSNKENLYVYFYSPECIHCQKTAPILMSIAKKLKIDVKEHNLLEYTQSWKQYEIMGTPTLIHFKNGKEISRMAGEQSPEEITSWFKKN